MTLPDTVLTPSRSVALVRVGAALIVATHPLFTLTHAAEVQALAQALSERGVPSATGVVWLVMLVQLLASAWLIAGRRVVPAAATSIVLLLAGAALLQAPWWYVAGGGAEDGHPGAEFNVLLVVCFAGVLVAQRSPRRGLEVILVGAAALLSAHPLHAFLTFDVEGMSEWGHAMEHRGFPFGVPLVWTVISVQLLSSALLVARRLVVPACLAQMVVLANGLVIVHYPKWFVVGPGENGMEFPLTYLLCFGACALAFWPVSAPRGAAVGRWAGGASTRS